LHIKPYQRQLDTLPFSKLFQEYLTNYSSLEEFFNGNPHQLSSLIQRADEISYKYSRQQLVTCLSEFNKRFEASDQLQKNVERFSDENAVAVVTGQQLNIMGGPLLIIYKTVTAIYQAKRLEEASGRPVIPVFWLGDEDHDYEEIKNLVVPTRETYQTLSFEPPVKQPHAVADILLNGNIQAFKKQIKELLFDTDFSESLWNLLDSCYKEEQSFAKAFGNLISTLFAKHGLVLAGSNTPLIKNHIKEGLIRAVEKRSLIEQQLHVQSEKVDQKYHQQVHLSGSNLFYLDSNEGRIKIHLSEQGNWSTESGKHWDTDELVNHIKKQPEKFSPNVFLRPVLQDYLLPTVGYVAGPGEVSYYAQMKNVYPVFDLNMPVILPRFNGTIIESAIDRILNKLPFEINEYQKRIEDLESQYVKSSNSTDIDRLFGIWKQQIQEISDKNAEKVGEIDPTLKKSVGSAKAVYFGQLDKLKGKLHSSIKKRERIQMDRIARIKDHIFPEDNLQERVFASIYYMNKYGVDVWDELLAAMEDGHLQQHNLIYL